MLLGLTSTHWEHLRHKLCGVVLRPAQEVSPAPQQEVIQGLLRIHINVNVVLVCPDLQAHQHDSNVERSIELQAEEETVSQRNCQSKPLLI